MRTTVALVAFAWLAASVPLHPARAQAVVVGSKPFGESYLLGEMFAQSLVDKVKEVHDQVSPEDFRCGEQ